MLSLLSSLLSELASTALMEVVLGAGQPQGDDRGPVVLADDGRGLHAHLVAHDVGVEFLPLGAAGLGTAAGWGLILRPWLRSPLVKPTLPLPFDVPGRSQPASTDSPTPTRVERATKDRRDVIRGAVLSERENAEGTGIPLTAPPEFLNDRT